jgi:release factor glutamine methyltransferase
MSGRTITFEAGGLDLKLRVADGIFEPNLTTRMLADIIQVPRGGRVLDLGCGVGPLAIYAAKCGAAEVVAIDIMPEACDYARANAELNGVADRVRVMQGSLFEPVAGQRFDLIIDDVSGMAESVSRISPWYPETIPSGGPDGTQLTIDMLSRARDYLKEKGQLYFPVLSLADSQKILQTARAIFQNQIEFVTDKWIPFCEEFKARLPDMESLREEGLIDYVSKRSRHLWHLEIFRAYA